MILSLQDTRASRSAMPAKGSARPTQGTFGRILQNTSVQLDLFCASSKTSADTSRLDSMRFSRAFEIWVTKLSQDCLQRQRSALLTNESDCLSWLTPRAAGSDGEGGIMENLEGKDGHYKLRDQVNWMTPDVSDRRSDKSNQQGLSNQVNWPTPKKPTGGGQGHRQTPGGGIRKLEDAIIINGRPDPDKSNTTGKNRGQLNPKWVSQLMGLPVGWTNVYSKGDINADNKIIPCGKGMCLLWQDLDSQEIQRTVRGLWGVSSPEVLQQALLQIEQGDREPLQDDTQEKGGVGPNGEMQPLPCNDNIAPPPPRYCQLRRCGNSLPEMPRTLTYCKWNVGKGETGNLRVDELRLLGNGVVPEQAEYAFRVLAERYRLLESPRKEKQCPPK